jgi:hypothetical protein
MGVHMLLIQFLMFWGTDIRPVTIAHKPVLSGEQHPVVSVFGTHQQSAFLKQHTRKPKSKVSESDSFISRKSVPCQYGICLNLVPKSTVSVNITRILAGPKRAPPYFH